MTQQDPAYNEIAFLPWVGVKDEIRIGPFLISPFATFSNGQIKDQRILDFLKKYFACYVNLQGQTVDTVAVCVRANESFQAWQPETQLLLRKAVHALCFSTICPAVKRGVVGDNFSLAPPDVDCFQLVFQRFNPEKNRVAISSGSLLVFGPTLDEMKFQQPPWVSSVWGNNLRDDELLKILGSKLNNRSLSTPLRRIFNALEWFRLSHAGGDAISDEARIVMTATAFESLLDLPIFQKKFPLMAEIDRRLFPSNFRRQQMKGPNNQIIKPTLAGVFIAEFYSLRNAIAHGERVRWERLRYSNRELRKEKSLTWITKQIVADLLLYELIWSFVCPVKDRFMLEMSFEDIHQALGWCKNV